jgi:protein-tyrosine-phosphatase
MTDKPTVLFVCVHNAGRSQMAAGYLQHLAGDRIEVMSSGSAPKDQINSVAAEVMLETPEMAMISRTLHRRRDRGRCPTWKE